MIQGVGVMKENMRKAGMQMAWAIYYLLYDLLWKKKKSFVYFYQELYSFNYIYPTLVKQNQSQKPNTYTHQNQQKHSTKQKKMATILSMATGHTEDLKGSHQCISRANSMTKANCKRINSYKTIKIVYKHH